MYIRVSRVGDRNGNAYRSPKQQEQSCRGWAEQNGIEVGKVVTEENVSGRKRAQDRQLEELLRRAEVGVSDGIIVYRINRFGRRMRDTVAAVGRLRDAGKRLVSVDDGYDTDQPSGQILLGVYAGIAEQQLDERTTNWDTSVSEAVAEGKHIACRAPIGYVRKDETDPQYDAKGKLEKDARLVEDPLTARVVREAFEMRRRGDSLSTVARWMGEQLDRRFSKSGVSAILANPVYMGIARGPKSASKPGAHAAIVDPELWRAVQKRERERSLEADLAYMQSHRDGLSIQTWTTQMQTIESELSDVRTEMWSMEDPGIPSDAEVVKLDGKLYVYRPWGEDPMADRDAVRKFIGAVVISRHDGRRRWQPIEERVDVTWVDGSKPKVPSFSEMKKAAAA